MLTRRSYQPSDLSQKCVLIVEDEYHLADDMALDFKCLGADVLGPVGRIDAAFALVNEVARIDGAVLDINLQGEMVFPLAMRLKERAIPFVFASGYDRNQIPESFRDVAICAKPVDPAEVALALFG